jgi:hypothetical protein
MLFTKILLGLSSSTRFFTIFHRFNANDRVLAQVSLAKSMPRTGPRLQHIDPTPQGVMRSRGSRRLLPRNFLRLRRPVHEDHESRPANSKRGTCYKPDRRLEALVAL